jgi:hypothetical protein
MAKVGIFAVPQILQRIDASLTVDGQRGVICLQEYWVDHPDVEGYLTANDHSMYITRSRKIGLCTLVPKSCGPSGMSEIVFQEQDQNPITGWSLKAGFPAYHM